MRWLDFAALGAAADRLDAWVAVTDGIDRFCTSSRWALPAQRAFMPAAEPFITESDVGIVALMTVVLPDGRRVGVPLEASWGLASPFASDQPTALVAQLRRMLAADHAPESLYLSGVARNGPWFEEVLRGFMGRARFGLGRSCGRRVADLTGGIEPWLAARSPRFRANLRRAARRAEEAGVRFSWHTSVDPADVPRIFARMMVVEERSWKGIAGVGVQEGEARDFYQDVAQRLAECGELRVLLGRQGDEDVVFVLGGVFGDTFRGLQMSFDDGRRDLSLGNVAQLETMQALAAEGVADYDLGTEMPYKMRWAPEGLETVTLALFPDT